MTRIIMIGAAWLAMQLSTMPLPQKMDEADYAKIHAGYAPIVKAIQVPGDSWVVWSGDIASCSSGGHFIEKESGKLPTLLIPPECEGGKRWTCEDKQRVLLTSEDDHHYCFRVE